MTLRPSEVVAPSLVRAKSLRGQLASIVCCHEDLVHVWPVRPGPSHEAWKCFVVGSVVQMQGQVINIAIEPRSVRVCELRHEQVEQHLVEVIAASPPEHVQIVNRMCVKRVRHCVQP